MSFVSPKTMCVAPSLINQAWDHVLPFLKAATEKYGIWTIDDLKDEIEGGALLWVKVDDEKIVTVAVTRLLIIKENLVCQVIACAGAADWREQMIEIEKYAKTEGCTKVFIEGRLGWARVLPDFRVLGVTLEKRLD